MNRLAHQRILLVGCGGIGGVLACKFARAGVDLTIVSTSEAVRATWLGPGPSLDGVDCGRVLGAERMVPTLERAPGRYDVVLVAVQPREVDEVAAGLPERLNAEGRVVCLPNGLCEDRFARFVGPERVIGAVIAWGARMPTPGHYVQTAGGGFEVGRHAGRRDAALDQVSALLSLGGPVSITDNLRGARFTKLAINCAVSTLGTIGGTTLGQLLVRGEVRDLALDILAEAVRVAHAEGTTLEPVSHLDLRWLVPRNDGKSSPLGSAARHGAMLALGARYRNLRSSMLSAIERGRAPSVDFLNGEVARRGAELGVPTPVNEAARRVVWEISRGARSPGPTALRRVRELSDALARAPEPSGC